MRSKSTRHARRVKQDSGKLLLFLPGVADKRTFLQRCSGESECAAACPHDSIVMVNTEQDLLMPFINPAKSPCYLCYPSPCTEACTAGALQQIKPEDVRMGTAQLDPYRCLCFLGQECKVCYESCPLKDVAIFWDFEVKAPLINMEKCVGCGVCLFNCPSPDKPIQIISA